MECPRCNPPDSVTLKTPSTHERWALVGGPNTGKSSLINALAGSQLSVGNWAGTTLERLSAQLDLEATRVELVDLPGTYSLLATSPEEALVVRELLQNPPDLVLNVLDAGNLERSLVLTLELMELGLPMALVVNLLDEAEAKGLRINLEALEEVLGLPVAGTVASRGQVAGVLPKAKEARIPSPKVRYPEALEEAIHRLGPWIPNRALALLALMGEEGLPLSREALQALKEERKHLENAGHDPYLLALEARYATAREIYRRVAHRVETKAPLTERLDRLVLHPLLGLPLFLLALFATFRFTFTLSTPWVNLIGKVQEVLAGWAVALPLPSLFRSFLAEGLVAGVGTVLAFAPLLFLLYLALAFLELSGFLARMAFVADRAMQWAGLPGKAFIPLVLGFGCNVPAVYATRTLTHPLDRLRTALAIPFMACGARLPVFTLFAFVFFPQQAPLVVLGLYLLGLLTGLFTALLLGKVLRAERGEGAMELPPYRFPPWRLLLRLAWARTQSFLQGAGGPILMAVLVVWALLHLPFLGGSPYAFLAKALTPLFHPLGLEDWRLVGALIPGFIAKEVVVGTLGVSFLGTEGLSPLGLVAGVRELLGALLSTLTGTFQSLGALFLPLNLDLAPEPTPLQAALKEAVSPSGALAYLVFVLLYTPCVATLAALRQVVGGKVALAAVVYQLSVAYGLAFLTSRLLP
ncbi:ferrous iron transport protein B [Thermus caldifontis]|uniref:ferrous iron transport protein B n=1 Tax=Thermus caldifontis TaxID=1930763 RepID=UPI000DF2BC89|nr:ferrous iron transport protein B [Thermus caldifontis]